MVVVGVSEKGGVGGGATVAAQQAYLVLKRTKAKINSKYDYRLIEWS
jgi:hypothetical protein